MNSFVDFAVVITLAVVIFGALHSFIKANRPKWFIFLVSLWAGLFFLIEIIGSFSFGTISENLVDSIPQPIMIGGTAVVAIVFAIHWIDLKIRRGSLIPTDRNIDLLYGDPNMSELKFKVLFWLLMLIQYVQTWISEKSNKEK